MDEELVIYTTYDSFEADKVMALFKSNGIPSFKREHGAGQYLSILFGTNTTQSIDIVIPPELGETAENTLRAAGYIDDSEENA